MSISQSDSIERLTVLQFLLGIFDLQAWDKTINFQKSIHILHQLLLIVCWPQFWWCSGKELNGSLELFPAIHDEFLCFIHCCSRCGWIEILVEFVWLRQGSFECFPQWVGFQKCLTWFLPWEYLSICCRVSACYAEPEQSAQRLLPHRSAFLRSIRVNRESRWWSCTCSWIFRWPMCWWSHRKWLLNTFGKMCFATFSHPGCKSETALVGRFLKFSPPVVWLCCCFSFWVTHHFPFM